MVEEINELKSCVCQTVSDQLAGRKVRIFFDRAFTRWMFNIVKAGKNPFTDDLTVNDLIMQPDVRYFFQTNPNIPMSDIDWSDVERKLESISALRRMMYEVPLEVSREELRVEFSNDEVIYTRGGYEYIMKRSQWELAKRKYNGPREDFNELVCLMLARYIACGTTRNHCSAPPEVIEFSRARCELFGSPINTVLSEYCSAFSDIERFFGSMGSFFDFEFSSGVYFMNPPYDESLILDATKRVFEAMDSGIEFTVIAVLPVWDVESQERHRGRIHVEKQFEAFELINNSEYMQSHYVMNYRDFYFYNYYTDSFTPVADTHLIVISNTDYHFTASEIAMVWKRATRKSKT